MNPSRPNPANSSTPQKPSSQSTFLPSSFPLLPRLEDLASPPVDPWDINQSNLDSILNQSTNKSIHTPFPLVVPPISAIDDKTLNIQSIYQSLQQQSDVLQTFHINHQSIIDNQPILPSVNQTITQYLTDEAENRSIEAANQLKACLDTIPAKFFDTAFDPIFEVLSFLDQSTNHAYTVYESENQSVDDTSDSYGSQRNRDANGELIEEDRDELININPYSTEGSPANNQLTRHTNHTVHNSAILRKQSAESNQTTNTTVKRKTSGRSFLSYIVNAFSPAASNLRMLNHSLNQSGNQSTHLSVQQFSSLSLSPFEEARAAQLLATLTAFLDLLEITISSQINQSSQSFFNTLLTVYELHNDLTTINQSINQIRADLKSINQSLTVAPMQIIRSNKHCDRLNETFTLLESVNQIHQDLARIRHLCDADQFASMLELMHQTRITLYSEPFARISCLKGVDQSIGQIINQSIDKLKAFFLRVAIDGTNDVPNETPIPSPAPSPQLGPSNHQSINRQSFNSSVNPCPSPAPSNRQSVNHAINEDDGDIIYAVIQCLYHIKGLTPTVTAYRDALLQSINLSIDQSVQGSVDLTRPGSPAESANRQALNMSINSSHKSSHSIEVTMSPVPPFASPSVNQFPSPSITESLSPTPRTSVTDRNPPANSSSNTSESPQRERSFAEALHAMLPASLTNSHRPSFTLSSIAAIHPPSNNQPINQPVHQPENPFFRQLAVMSFVSFALCLRDIHHATVALLNRSVETSKIVVRAIEHVPSPLFLVDRQVTEKHRRGSFIPEDLTSIALEIRHMFESSLDAAVATGERECVKLIDARYSSNALQASELMQLVSLMIELVIGYEVFVSLPQSPLRASLANHCSTFVSSFHAHQLHSVIEHVNREQWTRIEITKDMQNFIDSGYTSPLNMELSINPSILHPNNPTPQNSPSPPSALSGARVLFVERIDPITNSKTFVKFPVVRSVFVLMHSVACYLELVHSVPALVPHVSVLLIELLQSFTSRVRALILGAQALQTAGMKTITTTQLALCAQSLTFLTTQLPIIQSKLDACFTTACATRALRSSQGEQAQQRWTQSMQNVHKELIDQSSELIGKLCTIMTELSDQACKKFVNSLVSYQSNNQTTIPPAESPSNQSLDPFCDPSIRTLLQQTKSLNTSLTAVLSLEQRETLFANISRVYCKFVLTSLKRFDSSKSGVEQRMSATVSSVLAALVAFPKYDHDLAQQLADAAKIDLDAVIAQWKAEEEKKKIMNKPQEANHNNAQDENKVISDQTSAET